MEKKVNTASSKSEILSAYRELLERIQQQKSEDPKVSKEREEKKENVKVASQFTLESVIKGIADLKLSIGNNLDKLEESLIAEVRKLSKIREAIDTETNYLDELYQIKVNADTLSALLLAQKEKKMQLETEISQRKQAFEEEMKEQVLNWEKEKKEKEAVFKENESQQKKQRQREEEEYQYNLQISRKKDQDQYQAKQEALEKELLERKIAFEKEYTEREAFLVAKEKEWAELNKKVESFPAELEKAVRLAEKSTRENVETKYKFEAELLEKEIEGEKKLNTQIITSLEAKINEQTQRIAQLSQKADYAGDQVRDIAVKALEGVANPKVIIKDKGEE